MNKYLKFSKRTLFMAYIFLLFCLLYKINIYIRFESIFYPDQKHTLYNINNHFFFSKKSGF